MLLEAIVQGCMLGLSTGPFCLAACAPVLVPFLMAEERDLRQSAVCPPFLQAISSAAMASLWGSVLLFGGFFLGAAIYLLLLIPIGFLGGCKLVRITGMIALLISSVYFLGLGMTYLM